MPPASSSFTPLNVPNDVVPEWMGSFTLAAPPNTDLWRKPPSRDTSTAPILYTALRNPFIAAEVTVSADWELEWDQGGLVIFAGAPPGHLDTSATVVPGVVALELDGDGEDGEVVENAAASTGVSLSQSSSLNSSTTTTTTSHTSTTTGISTGTTTIPSPLPPLPSQRHPSPPPPPYTPAPPQTTKWVKAGLEYTSSLPHASSVVATLDGADWSLSSLPHPPTRTHLRIKIERIGYALWVWYLDDSTGWKKLREVTWFFWGVEDKAVRVGVYVSRPARFGGWEGRGGKWWWWCGCGGRKGRRAEFVCGV